MKSRYSIRRLADPETVDGVNASYLTDILSNYHQRDDIEVLSFTREKLRPGISGKLAKWITRYRLQCRRGDLGEHEVSVILKAGVRPQAWRDTVRNRFLDLGHFRLAHQIRLNKDKFSAGAPTEILSYRNFVPRFPIAAQRIYHTVCNEETERFWIFMEDISGNLLFDGWQDLSLWTEEVMREVIADMAKMHSFFWNDDVFFNRHHCLKRWSAPWIESTLPHWEEVLQAGLKRCSRFIGRKQAGILKKITRNLVEICTRIDREHHTLVHGDFSPMNLCLRPKGSGRETVLYDWESTAIYVPQFDLHFFINFLVDPYVHYDLPVRLIDFYLDSLPDEVRRTVVRDEFMDVYNLSALRYLATRELFACAMSDERKNPCMFRTLRHNLGWAERTADRYL